MEVSSPQYMSIAWAKGLASMKSGVPGMARTAAYEPVTNVSYFHSTSVQTDTQSNKGAVANVFA